MAGKPSPVERDATETLPGKKPDLPAVALLGPVAYAGSKFRQRLNAIWGRGWGRVAIAAVLGVLVVLLGVSLVNGGPELAQVPDVRGRTYQEAATLLQREGFTTDRVSFAPAADDQAGRVIETIPAPGTRVEGGSNVHLIAGAATPTPAPVVTEEPAERAEGRGKGKEGEGRDKDDG